MKGSVKCGMIGCTSKISPKHKLCPKHRLQPNRFEKVSFNRPGTGGGRQKPKITDEGFYGKDIYSSHDYENNTFGKGE